MVCVIIQSGRLLFEYIDPNMLIEGQNYFIKSNKDYIKARLENKNLMIFSRKVSQDYYYSLIPKSKIIQEKMEERSLEIILKKITGDLYFSW